MHEFVEADVCRVARLMVQPIEALRSSGLKLALEVARDFGEIVLHEDVDYLFGEIEEPISGLDSYYLCFVERPHQSGYVTDEDKERWQQAVAQGDALLDPRVMEWCMTRSAHLKRFEAECRVSQEQLSRYLGVLPSEVELVSFDMRSLVPLWEANSRLFMVFPEGGLLQASLRSVMSDPYVAFDYPEGLQKALGEELAPRLAALRGFSEQLSRDFLESCFAFWGVRLEDFAQAIVDAAADVLPRLVTGGWVKEWEIQSFEGSTVVRVLRLDEVETLLEELDAPDAPDRPWEAEEE